MLFRNDLHDYQTRAIDFIIEKKRCLLCLEMGLGKSVSTLTAVSDLIDAHVIKKTLVISPLRVAKSVWPKEPMNWRHLEHLKVADCTGSEKSRISALMRTADIYSINRENVKWLVDYYGKKWPFDCVVIDESSSFKNPSSQRFKALKRILPETDYMVLLTGTPSPNSLLDVWSQAYLIDFGMSLGRTMTGYKQRFFESDYMGYKWQIREGCADKIHELMKPYTVSMVAADYLELPEKIIINESVDMPSKAEKQYIEFEKELLIELENSEEIEAISAAALANKLLQWANGAVYLDETKRYAETHNAKLDALSELVECNDEPMLIAYNYKSDLERILKQHPDAVVLDKNPETIAKWNNGEIKLLLAHPASAGHGLNLQKGGSLCVWFGLNWSLELYQQFNARLYRQGQTRPVRIVHIVTNNTIDARVLSVLGDKDANQQTLIDALKGNNNANPN